ncbi:MAG: hypothetical protein ACR2IP_10555 [Solirubrobacteraceae bacterium]
MATYDPQQHRRVLERILAAQPSMREAMSTLRGYPFDVPEPLLLLTVAIARDVLGTNTVWFRPPASPTRSTTTSTTSSWGGRTFGQCAQLIAKEAP